MDYRSSLKVITDDIASLEAIIDDFGNIEGVPTLQVNIAKLKCRNAVEILTLIAESIEESEKSNRVECIECEEERVKEATLEDENGTIEETENKEAENIEAENNVAENKEVENSGLESENFEHRGDVEKDWEKQLENVVVETELDSKEPLLSTVETDCSVADNDSKLTEIADRETADRENADNQISHKTIIAETFNANPNTLIGQIGESATSTSVIAKGASNLFHIIGLNDKFLFVRELFNGNVEKYQIAIDTINKTDSYAKAIACAEKMVLSKERGEAFALLTDFIKRKFSVNG